MRFARATSILSLSVGLAACAGTEGPKARVADSSDPAALESKLDARSAPLSASELAEFEVHAERLRGELEALQNLRFVGMDEGPVPDFELHATNGTEYASARLLGQTPFVIVFFATWCDACTTKLASLRRALAKTESMLVIPVSVDGPETRANLPRYLDDAGRSEPVVLAADHPLFTLSYNPFDTVPLVVIVGQNGGLVDYQLGYEAEHERRLLASLRLAHTIGPLADPNPEAESSL